ncbi:MAG: MerR family transcriptional regulator [Clostridia bacterium]|nr:MerR family transcriptional regulator [Clostridia bacterium]NCC41999.1 MerR family transcriptional regulator [Clostridia bacterium]
MKTYSIGEVAQLLNISVSTLRYYDKEGLLDNVERTEGGIRVFKDKDIQQLHMVECLKNTGMQLKDIRTFFLWCKEGDSTIEKRYQMFLDRKKELETQMQLLQNSLDLVTYKCEFYRLAVEEGTLDSPKLEELKEQASDTSNYIKRIVG